MRNRDDFSHYKVINMIHVHCNFLLEGLFDICQMKNRLPSQDKPALCRLPYNLK